MDLGGMAEKGKDYAAKNPDAAKGAVDKAEGFADDYVGEDKAKMMGDQADKYIDGLDGQPGPGGPGGAPEGAPPEGEAPPA